MLSIAIFVAIVSCVKLCSMKIMLRFLAAGLFVSSFLFSLISFQTPRVGASQTSNTIRLKGLKDSVTIKRDERGVPYIEAKNADDLYFAQGYVTASDRLWQMDFYRRITRGELSEIFGRVPFFGSTTIEQDKLHRKYGWARKGEAMVASVSPQLRAALEAYSNGVNAYIASLDEKSLPPEFQILQYKPRPWTPADTLVAGKTYPEGLSMTWNADLMRATLSDLPIEKREKLLMEFSEDDVVVVGNDNVKAKPAKANSSTPKLNHQDSVALMNEASQISNTQKMSLQLSGFYAEDLAASNNWVVSGKRTVTGKPLLANDPHLALTAPSIWYMVHLSMPGMRVAGVTTPGFPGVLIGHNEHIAWGATNLGPDVQDLYLETFDTQNPNRYKTPNGWRDANVIREEIKIRKRSTSTETESEFVDVTETRHGPIILERDGKRYALQWTAFDPKSGEADTFFRFNYSRNWKDFTDALSIYKGVTFNFVYADVAGNIGYYGAGGIPIRKSGDGSTPYDGSTDDGEWIGYIPLKELPYLYNPPDGVIVTANQRVIGKSYKHFLSHLWASPYRAKRIKELLLAKPKHSADTFREIQADIFNRYLTTFTKELLKLNGFDMPMNGTMAVLMGSSSELSKDELNWNKTLSFLSGWDGRMTVDSKAAVLVSVIRTLFRQKILEAALGKDRARGFGWSNEAVFFNWLIKTKPVEWLPSEYKDYLSLLKDCEKEARATLTQRFGEDESKWIWSNFNPGRAIHPLSTAPLIGGQFVIEPFAINGGNNVPNVGAFVSMRFIADPSNWDATRQNIQLGQSGVPKSPHWKDQMQEWLNASPRVFPFSQTAIEKAAKEIWTLMPEK
jgi:penicillin amidase